MVYVGFRVLFLFMLFFTVVLSPDMLLLLVACILSYRADNKVRFTFTEATTSFSTKYFTKIESSAL